MSDDKKCSNCGMSMIVVRFGSYSSATFNHVTGSPECDKIQILNRALEVIETDSPTPRNDMIEIAIKQALAELGFL